MKFTLNEILNATNPKVFQIQNGKPFELDREKIICENLTELFSISTDTRTINQSDIYLPLRGENFDGHKFIHKAFENGSEYAFAEDLSEISADGVVFLVNDTLEAYFSIAQYYLQKVAPKKIAVTGSSGKTTTKEMVASVCEAKFKTHKTKLNHNNEIGFCQTILSMEPTCEVLVLEMGMRGLGEIELLSKWYKPDVAIITNVGTAHIGRLGCVENIAKAKCEVTEFISDTGILIAEDNDLIKAANKFSGEKFFVGDSTFNVMERRVGLSKFKFLDEEYTLNIEGEYNIKNAVCAIKTGLWLGMEPNLIRKGLENYKVIENRWQTEEIKGYTIINDAYNANPDSVMATLSTVIDLYREPLIVFGNMGELGDNAIFYHKKIGEFVAGIAIEKNNNVKFYAVGELAAEACKILDDKGFETKKFSENAQVARYILDNIKFGTTIFLKASRAMKFEEIIEKLRGEKL